MTSPLERAARALAQSVADQEPKHGGTFHVDASNISATVIDGTFDLRLLARAVIKAIRESGEAIKRVGTAVTRGMGDDKYWADGVGAYEAMIDALLAEEA